MQEYHVQGKSELRIGEHVGSNYHLVTIFVFCRIILWLPRNYLITSCEWCHSIYVSSPVSAPSHLRWRCTSASPIGPDKKENFLLYYAFEWCKAGHVLQRCLLYNSKQKEEFKLDFWQELLYKEPPCLKRLVFTRFSNIFWCHLTSVLTVFWLLQKEKNNSQYFS